MLNDVAGILHSSAVTATKNAAMTVQSGKKPQPKAAGAKKTKKLQLGKKESHKQIKKHTAIGHEVVKKIMKGEKGLDNKQKYRLHKLSARGPKAHLEPKKKTKVDGTRFGLNRYHHCTITAPLHHHCITGITPT